jgi:hypothetical protein
MDQSQTVLAVGGYRAAMSFCLLPRFQPDQHEQRQTLATTPIDQPIDLAA